MKSFSLIVSLCMLAICFSVLAQGTNPNYYQPRRIVNMPNAGLLPDKSWEGQIRLFEGGGLLFGFGIGLWGRTELAVSYGAHGVLGRGEPTLYPRPHFNLKIRPIQESENLPAIVIGYSGQGHGLWDKENKRYALKSPGIYLVGSKNYATFGGNLGFHIGVNYSLETSDEGGLNTYLGIDKNFGEQFAVSIEYNAALDDNKTKDGLYGGGKGYLNASFKWSVRPDFEIEFIANDLLINDQTASTFAREIRITFIYPL